jgi:hypothetical protein
MIEKTAARRHRRNRSLDDEAPLDRGNVDIHQCHEIEGTWRRDVCHKVCDHPGDMRARFSAMALAWPMATEEKSTAVTSHPCSASHIAFRPSPVRRSRAFPDGSVATSAAKN